MLGDDVTSIPFSFFVSLCKELSNVEPRSVFSATQSGRGTEPHVTVVFRRWVHELRRRFIQPPPQTTTVLFLFLFPEEDTCRKYGMQESSLARALVNVLGVSDKDGGRGANLKKWSNPSTSTSSLGEEVYNLMSDSSLDDDDTVLRWIEDMNSILDELASKSSFSASGFRQPAIEPSRTRQSILRAAYRGLRPFEAAVLTQIILKDLRPILYPVKNASTTVSLLKFNSKAVHGLTLQEAMRIWDPSCALLHCYKMQSTIEHSVRLFEARQSPLPGPEIGVPIQISKCIKGQGYIDALANFKSATSIWAETKYDGERMQIHATTNAEGHSGITIFSKSKRDSTCDRIATHWIVREALGLRHRHPEEVRVRAPSPSIRNENVSSVILEAEMVAYNEHVGIDVAEEFWRIRDLVESTAYGARSEKKGNQKKTRSTGPSETSRHLAIVFFDILYLNGNSLLSESYCARRAILEAVVSPIPRYASLARRVEILLSGPQSPRQALEDLQRIFSSCIANYEEGLVLKASHAKYADWRNPWVKLKKDYIPGYGDTMDFVIVAAAWEKERGRLLRVSASTYTTFYIGVHCSNINLTNGRPHLEVYFTVSYGLDRKQLEELNFLIKSADPVDYKASMQQNGLPFTFTLTHGLAKPAAVLTTPLLAELFGAGFSKSGEMKHYELRFPRISKVYRTNERGWLEGVNMLELNDVAHKVVGKDRSALGERDDLQILQLRPQPSTFACSGKRKSLETLSMENSKELDDGVPPAVYGKHLDFSSRRYRKRLRIDENTPSVAAASISVHAEVTFSPKTTKALKGTPAGLLKPVTNDEADFANSEFSGDTCFLASATHHLRIGKGIKGTHKLSDVKAFFAPSNEAQKPVRHPFATFLGRAIILSDCSFGSHEYDRTFITRFVTPNFVHSREAFALACGWNRLAATPPSCETISYGVVFVDKNSSRDWHSTCTLPFNLAWANSSSCTLEAERKPIFIFGTNCLRADTLDAGWLDNEMDIKAKCSAVYL